MPMRYSFQFQPYRRQFQPALQTSHGRWQWREGIQLCLRDPQGRTGWGEIAPLPWFGSETIAEATAFCAQMGNAISEPELTAIPDTLPACQFGFESAWNSLQQPMPQPETIALRFSGLLPAGETALQAWQPLWAQGYRTFKWKIGVGTIAQELAVFAALQRSLPSGTQLRLDANAALSPTEAQQWLGACDTVRHAASHQASAPDALAIEYLEQPLPPADFATLQALAADFATPIALDESVATLTQLQTCYGQGWQGVFVIKPAIVGSPARLRQFCQTHEIDAVFSSVFETKIGRSAGLRLAAELGNPDRAVGYGITHWFSDDAFSATAEAPV